MDEVISPSDADQAAWLAGVDAGRAQMQIFKDRWEKFAKYIVGDRVDLDDAILLCTTVDELAIVIDSNAI